MSTDGEKRPYFSRLVNAQGSRRLGPKYRLSKRVYSARAGQPLTAAYLFAPNGYRIAKLVRNAGLGDSQNHISNHYLAAIPDKIRFRIQPVQTLARQSYRFPYQSIL